MTSISKFRLLICAICTIASVSFVGASDTTVEMGLVDGSRIKGRIMSSTASDVTVMSEFGVFRIPLEKLTPEARSLISESSKPDVDALLKRVAELEAKVSQLQQENEALRRQSVTTVTPTYRPSALSSSAASTTTTPSAGISHTISSTGKRHNSNCRYFGSGRSCGSTDGIACKICGG